MFLSEKLYPYLRSHPIAADLSVLLASTRTIHGKNDLAYYSDLGLTLPALALSREDALMAQLSDYYYFIANATCIAAFNSAEYEIFPIMGAVAAHTIINRS